MNYINIFSLKQGKSGFILDVSDKINPDAEKTVLFNYKKLNHKDLTLFLNKIVFFDFLSNDKKNSVILLDIEKIISRINEFCINLKTIFPDTSSSSATIDDVSLIKNKLDEIILNILLLKEEDSKFKKGTSKKILNSSSIEFNEGELTDEFNKFIKSNIKILDSKNDIDLKSISLTTKQIKDLFYSKQEKDNLKNDSNFRNFLNKIINNWITKNNLQTSISKQPYPIKTVYGIAFKI